MKQKRFLKLGWVLLLTVLVLGLLVSGFLIYPAKASHQQATRHLDTASMSATIYLATATLAPVFQDRIDQEVPGAVNNAIVGIVGSLPAADRGWATEMATALISPSATLTRLVPQQGGLAAGLRLSLYPGDPQPINANMLIKFSVLNSTTVQVRAQPMPGSPALVNGPIATFQIPFGQLNGISATPTCGDAALAMNLQLPVMLSQEEAAPQVQQRAISDTVSLSSRQQPLISRRQQTIPDSTSSSYVEIPASSLASMGSSIGSLPISNNLTAQNIQITVQDSTLVITSDIMLDSSFRIGVATTTVQPTAASGDLTVHVLQTELTVFGIFTFPYDTYDQQIEQTLNSKLSTALTGKFTVTNAVIGPNSHIPCAASDSLILTGTTSLL
jgi:hypothetical protein